MLKPSTVLSGLDPALDGLSPVFVTAGADPRRSPGLDLPPGSIARYASGSTVWYLVKVTSTATDWVDMRQGRRDMRSVMSSIAGMRMGVAEVQTSFENFYFGSMDIGGVSTGAGGTGANFGTRAEQGGVWRATTGTDAGGIAYVYTGHCMSGTVVNKWHLACRAKLVTALAATTKFTACGLADGSYREVSLGAYGTSVFGGHATRFVCCYDGAAGPAASQLGLSSVAVDQNWHTFELWSNGSAISFSVDGETPVQTAATNTATYRSLYFGITHNSLVADTFDIDWLSVSMAGAV